MKAILKPSLLKIGITFIFLFVFSWLWQMTVGRVVMDVSYYGVPLHFFTMWGPCQAGQSCSEFNGLYLVLDAIGWYIIGAAFVTRFGKRK